MAKERKDKKGRILQRGEYQYPNGRYEWTYTDANGEKQKVYSWCLTETDKPPKGKSCDKCLRVLEREITECVQKKIDVAKARKYTLDELWEKHIAIRNLKQSTRTNYRYIYTKYIQPVFGNKKIDSFLYSDIIKFYSDLIREKGFKPNSMEVVHTILHPIFATAVKDKMRPDNPTDGAMAEIKKRYDWEKPKRHALTKDEQNAFIDFIKGHKVYSHWLPLFSVLLGTGLRVGELIGLRWEDCDFERKLISINHNLIYRQQDSGKVEFRITTPKTKAGIRVIPVMSGVIDALLTEKTYQMQHGFCKSVIDGYSGFIFCNRYGDVLSPHCINRAIERISRDYNEAETAAAKAEKRPAVLLPHFSVHQLRHTFCTRFCENETNVKKIQLIMGHSSFQTTMDIYAEINQDELQMSIDALEGKIKIS